MLWPKTSEWCPVVIKWFLESGKRSPVGAKRHKSHRATGISTLIPSQHNGIGSHECGTTATLYMSSIPIAYRQCKQIGWSDWGMVEIAIWRCCRGKKNWRPNKAQSKSWKNTKIRKSKLWSGIDQSRVDRLRLYKIVRKLLNSTGLPGDANNHWDWTIISFYLQLEDKFILFFPLASPKWNTIANFFIVRPWANQYSNSTKACFKGDGY